MKRRDFITLLGGAAAWPLAARGQQRAFPMIGLLSSRSPAVDAPFIALIRQGLNEIGFVEGKNVALDYRWAEGQYDRLAGLAAEGAAAPPIQNNSGLPQGLASRPAAG
jgi:putative tryptophan/tyrosine transport system substrate-binding protein